jgi:(2R)-sulfolactate sulfo-lyase subunit alpha
MSDQTPDFLAHRAGDAVAVAVRDLQIGPAQGGYLDAPDTEKVDLTHAVPLGHKLALKDIPQGGAVIEYGLQIATATADIHRGDYVHIHNVRSSRWETSVA